MSHSDYHTLINRGRRAGLGTGELYRAMAAHANGSAAAVGRADGNGFVTSYNAQGRPVYQPVGSYRRP
ncbi:MAG TPA: hypothetical protein VFA26_15700 [Gemmataceae bacterium]|nr:hypothetical protein [Gemmataceae bacterium]